MSRCSSVVLGILCVLVTSSGLAAPDKSREVGNGGDPIEMEFQKIGKELHARLLSVYPSKLKPIDLHELGDKVERARVEATDDRLFVGDQEKTAKNYRTEQLIRVNRARWISDKDPRRKVALVFHEYLGLMGDADLNYEISNYLLEEGALAQLVLAIVEYDKTANGPQLWDCYLTILRDYVDLGARFRGIDARFVNREQRLNYLEMLLKKYFVEGFETVSGSTRYQIAEIAYVKLENGGTKSLLSILNRIEQTEWSDAIQTNGYKSAMSMIASLHRQYARMGLPAECAGHLRQEAVSGKIIQK